ncbi:phage tail terminator-like protein [Lysobacter sp. HA35]
MSNALVRAALETRLATWAAARTPALPVAFENAKAGPALPYLRVNLLRATTTSATLDGAHRAYRGLLQVSIVAPIDAGPGVAEGIADEIAALFPVNQAMTASGLTVRTIGPASVAPALQHESDYTVPVSIPYRTDTP